MVERPPTFDDVIRQDPVSFLDMAFRCISGGKPLSINWHQEAILWQLERVRRGETTRLIVTMPPRNLKSITISVAWVALMLGIDPTLRFVCVSYSADLARKHAVDCRAIMQSDWYRRAFPRTRLRRGSAGEMDFYTTAGGGRLSTSVGGTLTGRGGDIVIIDDPIKPEDAMSETLRAHVRNWYSNTLISRPNDKKNGAIIVVMQRLHEEDLAGHLLETGNWDHLCLPAISDETRRIPTGLGRYYKFVEGTALHKEREDLEILNELKRTMGEATFSAQYQQSPVPAEGLHVQRKWFRFYDQPPERQPGDRIVQSWDTASKDGPFSDYSACLTALLRGRDVHVLNVFRSKLQFPELKRKVINHAQYWRVDAVLIEDAASGQQLLQILRQEAHHGVPKPIGCKPELDKLSRFSAQTHRIENGELMLPRDAGWLGDFSLELLGFPNRKHDDQVDALTQLLAWQSRRRFWPRPAGDSMNLFGPKLIEG